MKPRGKRYARRNAYAARARSTGDDGMRRTSPGQHASLSGQPWEETYATDIVQDRRKRARTRRRARAVEVAYGPRWLSWETPKDHDDLTPAKSHSPNRGRSVGRG